MGTASILLTRRGRRRPRARLRRLVAPGALAAVIAVTGGLLPAAPASAAVWPGHPDRSLVQHTVRPGETAGGLATTYHAWTRELLAVNRLGPRARLRVGQAVMIPIVVSAARRDPASPGGRAVSGPPATGPKRPAADPTRGPGWKHTDLSRDEVRRLVVSTARQYGVPPRLAVAVAWQESGWQQRQVSSAGALGVMQVMPGTGRWISQSYAHRRLNLRNTYDNVVAGVLTLKVLRAHTVRDARAIAAYYQGLSAVRRHGMYQETKRYVANVQSHIGRLARGEL